MNNKTHIHNNDGFTLIELLIATTVFSTILVILTQGLIQVTRLYIKGTTIAKTQDTAQTALSDITNAIQYSGGTIVGTPTITPGARTKTVFCIDNNRYTYQLDGQLKSTVVFPDQITSVALVVDQPGTCNPALSPQPALNKPQELMGTNMRLASLSITPLGINNTIWKVSINVVYGDVDLLNPSHNACLASISQGGQYCASSQLSTIVEKRVQ